MRWTAGSGDAMDPGPSARDRACGVGLWSTDRLSLHAMLRIEERVKSAEFVQKAQALGDDATVLAILGTALSLPARPRCGGSCRRARRFRSTAARHGRGAAADGSTSTRATPLRHRAVQDRAVSRTGRTASHSTAWSASAARISDSAAIPTRRIGRSAALAEHPSASWVHRTHVPGLCAGGAELTQARRSLRRAAASTIRI